MKQSIAMLLEKKFYFEVMTITCNINLIN